VVGLLAILILIYADFSFLKFNFSKVYLEKVHFANSYWVLDKLSLMQIKNEAEICWTIGLY